MQKMDDSLSHIDDNCLPNVLVNNTITPFEDIINDIAIQGYSVKENFILPTIVAELERYFDIHLSINAFKEAAIGTKKLPNPEIRSDNIYWLTGQEDNAGIQQLKIVLDLLTSSIKNELRLTLQDSEFHFAQYPEGSFYKKHSDQFGTNSNRIFTFILYLNKSWKNEDGGQLRMYTDKGTIDINPEWGTLVIFRSDSILHEVIPTNRMRKSLTGWLLKQEGILSKLSL